MPFAECRLPLPQKPTANSRPSIAFQHPETIPAGRKLGPGGFATMLPKPPPRETPPGFLYLPPFRVYGVSIAGEATCIQIPELDVCFDMGVCLRPSLASK